MEKNQEKRVMEKNQEKLRNLFGSLRKSRSTVSVISVFLLLSIFSILLSFDHGFFSRFYSIKQLLNKKALFCFFNAIVLFVARDSGVLTSSIELPIAARRPALNITVEKSQRLLLAKETDVEATKVEKMKPALMEDNGDLEEEEDDGEVDGEMEELGMDELNKKFEDFIKRVKKEIKMETLQVVMV